MGSVGVPVGGVGGGNVRVGNGEAVFRVIVLSVVGEVEGAGYHEGGVNHHDFVVSYGVGEVNKGREAGVAEEDKLAIASGGVAAVEDDGDGDASAGRGEKDGGNGR